MNTQATAVAADQNKAPSLTQELDVLKPQLEKVLPAHVSAEKFMRVVMTAIAQSPDLRNADRRSLLTSCVKAATDGLVPDGREAALVIFMSKGVKKVQYMPMVAGILKKVRNSGELLSIVSNVVYEKDTFRYFVDDIGEHVLHEPNVLAPERGKLTAVYAIAKTKDGGVYVEVMSRGQIDQVKAVSKSGENGPWGPWYDEMARKTVIRRLSKRLPMSTDIEVLMRRDDNLYDLNQKRLAGGQSGTAAAKELLGLPSLPDADDTDDDDDDEVIDTTTGEVVTPSQQADPRKPSATAELDKLTIETLTRARDAKDLNEGWKTAKKAYKDAGHPPPLDVEKVYTDRLADLSKVG